MALGLHVGSKLSHHSGQEKDVWERTEILSDLAAAVTEFLASEGLHHLAETRQRDDALMVYLHPAADAVHFSFVKGYLECRAITSSAGPGYHAAVVRLLDHASAVLGIEWISLDIARGYRDDTGYFAERNYTDLQVEMARHLTKLAGFLMSDESRENVQLSIPIGFPVPVSDFFAMSPMGFWEREIFEDVTLGTVHSLASVCEAFYPWWHAQMDGTFWRNAGLCLIWTDIPWHPPANDEERALYTRALKCFQKAYELDRSVDLPKNEMAEMAMFAQMDVDQPAPVPNSEGAGFLRRKLRRRLTGPWSAELPGYFYAGEEKQGRTALFWHNGMMMRVTAYGSPEELGKAGHDLAFDSQEDAELTFVSALEKEHMMGRAYLLKRRDETGDYWSLEGRITSPDGLCIISLTFPPDETYLDWAKEVFESVDRAA